MAKTTVGEEVRERIEYFEDWLERLSANDRDIDKVVNEKTAREFIRRNLSKDASLRNLVNGLDDINDNYDAFIQGSFIQNLIALNNKLIPRLDAGVARLKRKRVILEKSLPEKRRAVVRKKVITNTMTNNVLKMYGLKKTVNKKGVVQYRDLQGRFAKNDALMNVADRVIASSARERKKFDEAYKNEIERQRNNRPRKQFTKEQIARRAEKLDNLVDKMKKDSDELDELLKK
jgi:hypothetical protein